MSYIDDAENRIEMERQYWQMKKQQAEAKKAQEEQARKAAIEKAKKQNSTLW